MRKSIEIRRELEPKLAEFDKAEGDARAALQPDIDALTQELNDATLSENARRAMLNQRTLTPAEKSELRRFSIAKFIREAADNALTGIEKEMNEEGLKEFREVGVSPRPRAFFLPTAILRDATNVNNATDTGYGEEFKDITRVEYLEGLRNKLVMSQLGATYVPNLQGNLKLIVGQAASAAWKGEGAITSETKLAYTTKEMHPKRLQIVAGYTGELLRQSSLQVDTIIMGELQRAHANALDAAAIAGTGLNAQPVGILSTTGIGSGDIGTNGGPIDWKHSVGLETLVGAANGLFGKLSYLTNSKVLGELKSIPKVAGYPAFLMEDGKLNGYDVAVTNAVPSNLTKGTSAGNCSAMIFGNFEDLYIAQWGGLDFIVDPFSRKEEGIIEVSLAGYHDILVRRPACFAAIKDITIS